MGSPGYRQPPTTHNSLPALRRQHLLALKIWIMHFSIGHWAYRAGNVGIPWQSDNLLLFLAVFRQFFNVPRCLLGDIHMAIGQHKNCATGVGSLKK